MNLLETCNLVGKNWYFCLESQKEYFNKKFEQNHGVRFIKNTYNVTSKSDISRDIDYFVKMSVCS